MYCNVYVYQSTKNKWHELKSEPELHVSIVYYLCEQIFLCVFQDETRVNCTADRVAAIDFRKEASRLADEIEKLMVSNGQV